MCLYPKLIRNPKYKENKKNGGVIPHFSDSRVLYVPIGCGGCIECKKQKAREWKVRLKEEIKHNVGGKFITLTFSNDSYSKLYREVQSIRSIKGYGMDNAIATLAVRRFLERWRKKYKVSIRHWLITELGHEGTEHIHLHGILWGDVNEIEKIWGYGFVWKGKRKNEKLINYVNGETIGYMMKYFTKVDLKHKQFNGKVLCSQGIGKGYIGSYNSKLNKYKKNETREYYVSENGTKMKLPIYYRNKIYSDDEKEKLWIEKLDKQERFILGKKVDISKTMERYIKGVEEARRKNSELGYGKGWLDYDQKIYENTLRLMKQRERLKPISPAAGSFQKDLDLMKN